MDFWRKGILFTIGGGAYMGLEMLWRRRTHGSMFFAGGLCFLIMGKLRACRAPLLLRAAMGALSVTAVELLFGLTVNRDYRVWDYRALPGNYRGQICPLFALIWVPVSLIGMGLYDLLNFRLNQICRGGS